MLCGWGQACSVDEDKHALWMRTSSSVDDLEDKHVVDDRGTSMQCG